MTCSASINCSDVYSSNTIEVLPDIVGLGVRASVHTLRYSVFADPTLDFDLIFVNVRIYTRPCFLWILLRLITWTSHEVGRLGILADIPLV